MVKILDINHKHFFTEITDGKEILSLNIDEGKRINLADSRQIGHSLTPMKYMEDKSLVGHSAFDPYEIKIRFSTLRITPKKEGEPLAYVVGIIS